MPTAGPTRLDALGALVSAAAEASGKAKHVYVLKFFGDVTASQVAQLRQEVTAVLGNADAEGRGDEVVLVLNTGGGTVTGYPQPNPNPSPNPNPNPNPNPSPDPNPNPNQVTGYGLAAAQLERLKQSGLKLTICVEQVGLSPKP